MVLQTVQSHEGLHFTASCVCRIFVNLETKEKNYCGQQKHMCPRDGWVCFHNSELVSGRLGKATLGGGNKAGLFQVSLLSTRMSPYMGPIGFAELCILILMSCLRLTCSSMKPLEHVLLE